MPETPAAPATREEVDSSLLDPEEAKKRCGEIYRLEKKIEARRASYELLKGRTKTAKTSLNAAEEALDKEIADQRFGPGPLVAAGVLSVDGKP